MLNNKNNIIINLRRIGLAGDEAKVYLALLEEPMTHLELARKTGINRTKVYRLADDLISRSLITYEQTDEGKFLSAADPSNLEVMLVTQENKLESQRNILDATLPALKNAYKARSGQDASFAVNTYEGVAGFKQMLWNELKTKGEILCLGNGTIQELIDNERWAEKHRAEIVEAGYKVRELLNPGTKQRDFTKNDQFMKENYSERFIDADVIPLTQQICIYNNSVNTYNWRDGKKVGFEVISESYANTMRAMFEYYWSQAENKALVS